jgi:Na+/H+ antiporter NhaC
MNMIGWLFPLFLLSFLATTFLGRRVDRRAAELAPTAREQLSAAAGGNPTPSEVRRAVLRGQVHGISDAEFIRSCQLYRVSILLYLAVLATLAVAVGYSLIAG